MRRTRKKTMKISEEQFKFVGENETNNVMYTHSKPNRDQFRHRKTYS